MARFRKLPVVIEASQWEMTYSEHERVIPLRHDTPESRCGHCDWTMESHGWIETLEGGHIVCPGDWIITGVAGEVYPCKPDIFDVTYEEA